MHPADINAFLIKAGSSQAEVARALKVSPAAVSLVVQGTSRSQQIAKQISAITGLQVSALWPGRYPRLLPKAKAKAIGGTRK